MTAATDGRISAAQQVDNDAYAAALVAFFDSVALAFIDFTFTIDFGSGPEACAGKAVSIEETGSYTIWGFDSDTALSVTAASTMLTFGALWRLGSSNPVKCRPSWFGTITAEIDGVRNVIITTDLPTSGAHTVGVSSEGVVLPYSWINYFSQKCVDPVLNTTVNINAFSNWYSTTQFLRSPLPIANMFRGQIIVDHSTGSPGPLTCP